MIRSGGFTLIELMIAVVIIAVLAAIGYPAYQSQVEKGHLSEGRAALTQFASQLERCYSRFGSYNDSSCDAYDAASSTSTYYSENDTYKITFDSVDTDSFVAKAERNEVTSLNECGDLTLSHTGQKGIDNADSGVSVDDCW